MLLVQCSLFRRDERVAGTSELGSHKQASNVRPEYPIVSAVTVDAPNIGSIVSFLNGCRITSISCSVFSIRLLR